jgi:hypothetical protein
VAKRLDRGGYYYRDKEREDVENRRLNLAMRMQEALDLETVWEVMSPVETPPTYSRMSANSTNPPRPRARKIAYSSEEGRLVIQFRDNTLYEYRDVPVDMWLGLKATDSTGKYLRYSGLDNYDDKGFCDPTSLPEEVRVFFAS